MNASKSNHAGSPTRTGSDDDDDVDLDTCHGDRRRDGDEVDLDDAASDDELSDD